ncbi:hypothetical protein BKA59DRAFT_425583 [Fusarium tricinctum]|uniref:EamA domain-containing protein n=1 Tax=Fusarium tricinctum TaxID=61284 RepID=A0A8K0RMV4_9HYPO|nr:hypothetical protein BKA59DRAFT_425583 [Fusarium tricinctum]
MSREMENTRVNENEDSEGTSLLAEPARNDMPAETDESPSGISWERLRDICSKNIGLFYVLLAQLFASIMSMTTRLLETGFETKFHALQIIFVRMLATALICSSYMWHGKVPDFPFGPREVRGLLILRGMAGSAGLFGLYYSLSYLDVCDATVITFLVPTLTAFIAWVALREPFTVKEAAAGFIAFAGVLCVARPAFLFSHHEQASPVPDSSAHTNGGILPPVKATPQERTIAIFCSIFGSIAAATAYSTIRVIGKRAHSLVSVNYFATLATISSFVIITIHPRLHFEIPNSGAEWILLLSIGVSGFMFQLLLTEGLQREKAGRATNLIYVQMVFAVIIERVVWGTTPPLASFVGSALIIGSAVWVTLQKKTPTEPKPLVDEERASSLDQERQKAA